ncbi:unnamed protein product [Prorocentrum cordatum]|uniref:K Homology domain-containing protein n=1 Tax=Prorocentrum cordatum TaxID=2364126 RepID=A0ABN9PUG9_9DINO|nr:unnamed protein product [Polarella glacialis]
MVIGLKGSQVNQIQQDTGTKIDVDFDTDPCKCFLKGEPSAVEAAKKILLTIAMQIEDGNSEYLDLPKQVSGVLIGSAGSKVREFQEQSGARIDVDKTGNTCRVRLTGTAAQVANAKQLIRAEIEQDQQQQKLIPMIAPVREPMVVPAHQPNSFPATLSESIARAKAAAQAVSAGLITRDQPFVPSMGPPPAPSHLPMRTAPVSQGIAANMPGTPMQDFSSILAYLTKRQWDKILDERNDFMGRVAVVLQAVAEAAWARVYEERAAGQGAGYTEEQVADLRGETEFRLSKARADALMDCLKRAERCAKVAKETCLKDELVELLVSLGGDGWNDSSVLRRLQQQAELQALSEAEAICLTAFRDGQGGEAPAPLREIARPVLRVECPPALADQRASDDELRLTARKTIVAGGFREEDILSVELSANRTVCLVEVSLTA